MYGELDRKQRRLVALEVVFSGNYHTATLCAGMRLAYQRAAQSCMMYLKLYVRKTQTHTTGAGG